nr:BA14K family protein [Kaistia sp. 32K]
MASTPLPAIAAPLVAPAVAPSVADTTSNIIDVQYRGRNDYYYRHHRPGYGPGYRPGYRPGYGPGYRPGYWNGYSGYRYERPGYRYYNGWWYPLAAFGVGAAVGSAIAQPPAYYGGGSYASAHYQWCENRYRSYRASDNTFQPNNGPRRQCVSPY